MNNTTEFETKYGKISIYNNDIHFINSFKNNIYWDESTLNKIKNYIPNDKNIIEIGGHCGTSTLFYSRLISDKNKYYVFEPQQKMYDLLVHNIKTNNLQNKIEPSKAACFCFTGNINMNSTVMDGPNKDLNIRSVDDNKLVNYGGLSLGKDGENVTCYKLDDLQFNNIGFIHCDAQGAENFLFHGAKKLLKENRPVILYENKDHHGPYLYNMICSKYPEFKEESKFDLKDYCMKELNYSKYIDRFDGSVDTLLIP